MEKCGLYSFLEHHDGKLDHAFHSETKPRLQVAAFQMCCFAICKMCIIFSPKQIARCATWCVWRITHPVHNSKDGDEQGVGTDRHKNPNPGKSTVNFITIFFLLTVCFTLVPYRKWPGSSQRTDCFLDSDTFLVPVRSLYLLQAAVSSDCCAESSWEAGKWPYPHTYRCRGCCCLLWWAGSWRCYFLCLPTPPGRPCPS